MRFGPARVLPALATLGLAATMLGLAAPAGAQDSAPIAGGGSSFAQLEFEQWRADVAHPPHDLSVGYLAAGSTLGRSKFASGEFDFAATDIEWPPTEPAPGRSYVHVPTSVGALGFMYNLKGTNGTRITTLRLSQANACRALTESGIYWDDPAITGENPGVPLPHNLIRRVVRSDGSGTSYALSEFCIATAPHVWNAFRATLQFDQSTSQAFKDGLPTSNWPQNYSQSNNAFAADGVANAVGNEITGQNSITYAEAGFAKERGYPNALIKNNGGEHLLPDAGAVTQGLGHATPKPNGTFQQNYSTADPQAYFPVVYSYVVAPTNGFDPAKGSTLAKLLNYAVTDGQDRAVPLGYARLPANLVSHGLDQIAKIPGAPPRPADPEQPPPVIPEAPMVIVLPLIVLIAGAMALTRRRYRA